MLAKPDLTQIERDKLDIDPDFDFKNDIATRPFEDLTSGEIGMFKWTGIYQQLQKGFFMLRLRVPGGLITSDQLDRAADLAARYGQDQLCITTRQTLQFHWLRKEDLYKVLEGMAGVGMDSRNACGDVTRNVVTCPLQGVCPHEIGDVRPTIEAIANDPVLLDQQRNLPRKHKISVAGCGRACGQTLMNCEGWHPVARATAEGARETGWKYHAGGGLGARPFMARAVFDWVPGDLVVPVTRAATEYFRRHGNRRVRAHARLKFLVHEMGPRRFGEELLSLLREWGTAGLDRIEFARAPAHIEEPFVDGQSVIEQRQPGCVTVRIMVLRSEMTSADARRFAAWARGFGNGTLMLTNRQNIHIRFVAAARVEALVGDIRQAGYATEGFERLPDMVACVGTTYCNLAVSDTPNTYRRLYQELASETDLWRRVGSLRIHLNGCPNSCAQHWIADIGLRGMRKEQREGSEEGFSICVGGGLSGQGYVAQTVCDVPSSQVVPTVRRMLEIYLSRREPGEAFGVFVRRIGAPKLAALIGAVRAPAEPTNETDARLGPLFDQVVIETGHGA